MKQHTEQLSIFDIVIEHNEPPIEDVKAVCKTDSPQIERESTYNKCPYKIPTVDEIIKRIDKVSYKINKSKLISDIFECGALAISNKIDFRLYDEREERYKQIMDHYAPKERNLIAEIFVMVFALLSSVVYDDGVFNDYLGELFMKCNQGNKNTGQFFTPYHISEFMAQITLMEQSDNIKQNKIITICDPCCGSAGMVLAAMDVLKNEYKINYTMNSFVECADIDIRCVHMAYLQLSLAGVPAIIKHMDSLTQEVWSVWKTPAFIFQYSRFCRFE